MKKYLAMKILKMFCLLLVLTFYVEGIYAQEKSLTNFPLKISILDESLALPNLQFLGFEYNPAMMIGTEYILKKKEKSDWHLTGNVGFYHHKDWQTAVFVNSEMGYRYHFGRLSASARLGIGYAHAFANKPVYGLKDGEWQEVKNTGVPKFISSLALGLEYRFNDAENSPSVFLTYMSAIDVPISIFNGLHQLVGVGVKFYPFK